MTHAAAKERRVGDCFTPTISFMLLLLLLIFLLLLIPFLLLLCLCSYSSNPHLASGIAPGLPLETIGSLRDCRGLHRTLLLNWTLLLQQHSDPSQSHQHVSLSSRMLMREVTKGNKTARVRWQNLVTSRNDAARTRHTFPPKENPTTSTERKYYIL